MLPSLLTYNQACIHQTLTKRRSVHGLRKRAKYFVLFGGKLQYVGGNKKNTPRLVVEDEEDRRKIIESIHGQAHLGRDKTLSQLTQRYYWPNMHVQDSMCLRKFQIYIPCYSAGVWCIERYFSCRLLHVTTACQRQNHKLHKTNATLHIPFLLKKKPGIRLEWI